MRGGNYLIWKLRRDEECRESELASSHDESHERERNVIPKDESLRAEANLIFLAAERENFLNPKHFTEPEMEISVLLILFFPLFLRLLDVRWRKPICFSDLETEDDEKRLRRRRNRVEIPQRLCLARDLDDFDSNTKSKP